MDDKPFSEPIAVTIDGQNSSVATVREAYNLMADVGWPGNRDDRHTEACETCLKVLDGHRSVEDAETVFREIAIREGLLDTNSRPRLERR